VVKIQTRAANAQLAGIPKRQESRELKVLPDCLQSVQIQAYDANLNGLIFPSSEPMTGIPTNNRFSVTPGFDVIPIILSRPLP
jgi:hypothetical protein